MPGKQRSDPCSRCGALMYPTPNAAPERVCRPCRKIEPKGYGLRAPRVDVVCPTCGGTFTRGPKTPRQVYCSKGCATVQKNRARAGAVTGKPRGRDKDKERANTSAKRARRKATFMEKVYPSVVFERDNYRCHLCGKKCKRGVSGLHPEAPTMDHVIPTA